jgi:hypothetical protein
MPLTDQERRCVELAARYLADRRGGAWPVPEGPTVAELDSSEPSPEVVITNGFLTAAVEVKEVRDAPFTEYRRYLLSLNEFLKPTAGGYHRLDPAPGVYLPLDRLFKKQLRREVERVAKGMAPGETRPVRVPQEALLKLVRSEPGPVFCAHYFDTIRRFSDQLPGSFFLVDGHCMDHKLFTEQGERDFAVALEQAAQEALANGSALMRWYEEWELERVSNKQNDELWFMTVTEAHDVPSTVVDAVEAVLAAALRKFLSRRWGDIHLVVLDKASTIVNYDLVVAAVSELNPEDLHPLDAVLLADGDHATPVWERDE